MADIFVSYASSDRERVAGLVRRLEQLGFTVWWDRDIAHGQNYHRVIEQALDEAKCAIVVWSAQSVNSEWVVNEASSARKRNALVPVLLEAVEAPLEFRHLQTADLREENPNAEREYEKLKRSVRQIVGSASPRAVAGAFTQETANVKAKSFWQTPIGWAIGAGVLLLGLAALLAALKQIGWLGQSQTSDKVSMPPGTAPAEVQSVPPAAAQSPAGAADPAADAEPTSAASGASAAKAAVNERVNLLDPEQGAQIVAAGEEGWRRILEAKQPVCVIISGQTFAVVALRNEQPTRIDTLAVHVDAQSSYNLKTLVLFAADAERGPFKQIGEFEIPNYKNMRSPFHEFKFEATTARFVKLHIANFVHGDAPNGNVCTMRLLGVN